MASAEEIKNSKEFYNSNSVLSNPRYPFYKNFEYKRNWFKTTTVICTKNGFLFRSVNTCIENDFDGSSEVYLSEFLVLYTEIETISSALNKENIEPIPLSEEEDFFCVVVGEIFRQHMLFLKLVPTDIDITKYKNKIAENDPIKENMSLLLAYFKNKDNDVDSLKKILEKKSVSIISFGTESAV